MEGTKTLVRLCYRKKPQQCWSIILARQTAVYLGGECQKQWIQRPSADQQMVTADEHSLRHTCPPAAPMPSHNSLATIHV